MNVLFACSHGPCQAANVPGWKDPAVRGWPALWGSRELILELEVHSD